MYSRSILSYFLDTNLYDLCIESYTHSAKRIYLNDFPFCNTLHCISVSIKTELRHAPFPIPCNYELFRHISKDKSLRVVSNNDTGYSICVLVKRYKL